MNSCQILLTIMIVYWSDIITGPYLYVDRKLEHWFSMRKIKKELDALKKAKEAGLLV